MFIFIIGCSTSTETEVITKVGLLLPDKIDDQGWNGKGYEGLLKIHSNLNFDVFYKEEINTKEKSVATIDEFLLSGANLIFGHGQMYAPIFMEIKDDYPDIHFVVFNGEVSGDRITSLRFQGYSMVFFAGMLASEMSETKNLGVIAAEPWQPEVKGFKEGALFQNKDVDVIVKYVSSWIDVSAALEHYHKMVENDVDVFYPAGDGYHVAVIEEIKKDGLSVIGFVGDHSDLGESTVLTSTIQHADELYEIIAEKFHNGQLATGNMNFDFSEGVISLGPYSPEVPLELQKKIDTAIRTYIETGKMPSETN
ncbi:BMP family ABC transporter substrate-binding protein [Bacillaceae bacterium IKA-2]|nr:BMP family ABC transporter substrate-binding protein [Bacillaceae bacterium IKA-2]